MTKSNKRSRPIPNDKDEKLESLISSAKSNAINLINVCFSYHKSIPTVVKDEIMNDLHQLLEMEDKDLFNHSESNTIFSKSSNNKRHKGIDRHNEFCDVCSVGGELLCCDTCSLVFHLDCLRPKLLAVPKGRWSCAYCIIDDMAKGDVDEAKRAITQMKKLHSNNASKDNSGKNVESFITKFNKKYLVQQKIQDVTEEIGRFNTLEGALESIAEDSTKRLQGPIVKPKHRNQYSKPLPIDSDDEDGLWCIYCLDDPNVTICAFCGCRICFGKHDSKFLLLCDECDQEAHTYCLDPPLLEIPGGAWFCKACSLKDSDSVKEPVKLNDNLKSVKNVPEKDVISRNNSIDSHSKVSGVIKEFTNKTFNFNEIKDNYVSNEVVSSKDFINAYNSNTKKEFDACPRIELISSNVSPKEIRITNNISPKAAVLPTNISPNAGLISSSPKAAIITTIESPSATITNSGFNTNVVNDNKTSSILEDFTNNTAECNSSVTEELGDDYYHEDGSQSNVSIENSSILDGSNQSGKGRRGRPKGSFKCRSKSLNNTMIKDRNSREEIGTRLRTNINRNLSGIGSLDDSIYSLDEIDDNYNLEILENIVPSVDNAVAIATKMGNQLIKPNEKNVLAYIREWGSITDVQKVLNVLVEQRQQLLTKYDEVSRNNSIEVNDITDNNILNISNIDSTNDEYFVLVETDIDKKM